MRTLSLVISADDAGRTVKSVLRSGLMLSAAKINSIKYRETGIMLNGVRVHTNAVVREGDILTAEIGDDAPAANSRALPEGCARPEIRYSDDDIIILDKPAGLAVHASFTDRDGITLFDLLTPELCGSSYHPVNRLDKGTTGLMTVAKSGYIHDRLRRMLHTPQFLREYTAAVEGVPSPECGTIDLPIARESFIKRCISDGGQPAVTRYETLKSDGAFSLLRVKPETGRTHQIRLHLASIGCPIAGDWLYGHEDKALISRPALHSSRIILTHPVTGEILDIFSDIPDDMKVLFSGRE